MVSGWLKNSLHKKRKSDETEFDWNANDQGIITGNIIELREIINAKDTPFQSFRIETDINYKWKNCNKKMVKPCPYYYTAFASLGAPIVLALATLSIIICLSKCYKRGNLIAFIWFLTWEFLPKLFTNALSLFRHSKHLWSSLEKSSSAVCFSTFSPFYEIFQWVAYFNNNDHYYLLTIYRYYAPWLSLNIRHI